MTSSIEVWVCTSRGGRLYPIINFTRLRYTKVANDFGVIEVVTPDLDFTTLYPDMMLQIWRSPRVGTAPKLDTLGFLRKWEVETNRRGQTMITLYAYDLNELLTRRIVAYPLENAKARTVSINVDNAMKDVFLNNFLSGAVSARDLTNLNVTVQTDHNDGTAIDAEYPWKSVLKLFQDWNNASRVDGPEIFFMIEVANLDPDTGEVSLEFRTKSGQPGNDKTFAGGTGKPVLFGLEFGNLESPELIYDYTRERNYIYVAAQGRAGDREIVEVSDSSRINLTQWNRREDFVPSLNETTAGATDKGNAYLNKTRPVVQFRGQLTNTSPSAQYGIDWFFGDKVTSVYQGILIDGIIRTMIVDWNQNGEEIISARVFSEAV